MWENDICWCSDSVRCNRFDCFRHLIHKNDEERIFTCGHLMGEKGVCPRSEEGEN